MNRLFLCVANSTRSPLAEALARNLFPTHDVLSAGSVPTAVRPEVLKVLSDVGIDAGTQTSKAVTEIDADGPEVVMTLCAEEVCPVYNRKVRRLHWPIEDPALSSEYSDEERWACLRVARDQIQALLQPLKTQI